MQGLPRWRNVLTLKNSFTQSPTTLSTSFHSTGVFLDKWRNKFDSVVSILKQIGFAGLLGGYTGYVWEHIDLMGSFKDVKGNQQPAKNYIRYTVRQKRADTKKAFKSILFKGGRTTSRAESFLEIEADFAEQLNKKSRTKPARQAKRDNHKKLKRKHRRDDMCEDFDENPDGIFRAAFGKHGFTWTFRPSGMRFNWTENQEWTNCRHNHQEGENGKGYGEDSFTVGTYADRKILGLPAAGPLKIEDVKAAFRSSALKWHPDKNQGSSESDAEEKFKHCVDAYRSLCKTFSTA